ncbi:MAG TPA: TlpA disulfide reductase family protein [Ramlibacter sp.]|nr:TlpA disulfide reductase family protein [Ramlibacter sp.]
MTQAPSSKGRRLLVAGVGAAAAIAGAGLAWWRFGVDDGQAGAADALWKLSFDTPTGGRLDMSALKGRPLLVNFWATWCPPCVEELPLLDAFSREQAAKKWQVVGLAIDQPSAVRTFLSRTPVSFPVGLAGLEGTELGKALGNRSGGLPFTVVFGADATVRHRRMGRVTPADLAQWSGLS